MGGNSGLTPIVIVIECHLLPLFFSQKWHPDFWIFWYNYNRRLPPLWVRSGFAPKSGGKVDSKRDEKDLDVV